MLWGTAGTAQALGPSGSHPLQVGSLRLIVAAIALGAVAGLRPTVGDGSMRRPATLLAALAMAAYQPLFFTAVDRIGVAVGTLIAIGSAPLFAGTIQATFEGIRPTRRWTIASAVAVAGLVMLAGRPGSELDLGGIAAALGAGLSYAVFASAVARMRAVHPTRSMAAVFGLAGAITVPLLGSGDLGWLAMGEGLLMVAWLGVMATAAAYLLFATGLATTDVNRTATLSLGEPVTATILAVTILDERVELIAWLGAGLIVAALISLVRPERYPSVPYSGGTKPGS